MTSMNKEKRIDWICRILITIQLILVITGYISLLQTKYQLESPLIPQSLVYEISYPNLAASLITSGFMIMTLWLYFLNKRVPAIWVAASSLLLYEIWVVLFLK